ncbi:MAG: protein translocase subunit SecD [Actinobacteria bacterium]|jgi:preprotein translocase subunit SecD|nr:protein translocase subunit SecD [Actinomycetota bacterium]MBT3745624.1 protein translocase subunit SecD [Actinomycetota bacterium]MBT3968815.1 protein translocase subunit SecD [Actinomycetota bacterium]MBT4010009.1 protein translocase subunit SecD [Actinomycetota bacterium]MBT4476099.1 protein translocase subunit SecD [Actinomycetota bacterium]
MPSRQRLYLIGILLLSVASLSLTMWWGNEPLLGLDLQGGVSVRLTAVGEADEEMLDQAVEVIRARVDGLGVAEPEISRTATGVMVSLPGVDDQTRALELVGTTAELRFRPVCETLPAVGEQAPVLAQGDPGDAPASCWPLLAGEVIPATGANGLTAHEDDHAPDFVVLTDELMPGETITRRLVLGPTILTGDGLSDADANFVDFAWQVSLTMKEGASGIDAFNAIAAECFAGTAYCPVQSGYGNGQVALVLDGQVITAPQIRATSFQRDAILISGSFDKQSAEDAALALRYGALPIELVAENTQLVSATIGEDALKAGIIAGLVGLAAVALFIVAYYRILGLVALASLAISGSLLWAIIAHLGTQSGLALTLAGVTGIVVAIGVSVDSNVVYFEHLKEDIRDGRTARSSVERAFKIAFSTIIKANTASLIGAGLLWWLTVGAVRGFALYLGLATILDLVATKFFMGPMIDLLARSSWFKHHPLRFGLPADGAVKTIGEAK